MFAGIAKKWASPEPASDKSRASMLNSILTMGMAGDLGMTPVLLTVQAIPPAVFLLNIALFVFLLVLWIAARRNHVRVASALLVFGFWVYATILLMWSGIGGPVLGFFYALVLMAALFFGDRGLVVSGALSILSTLAILGTELANIRPFSSIQSESVLIWSIFLTTLLTFIVLVLLSNRGVTQALENARQELTQRRHAEEHAQHRAVILGAVRAIEHMIVHEHDAQQLLNSACQILVNILNYKLAWIGQAENGKIRPVASAGEGTDYINIVLMEAADEITAAVLLSKSAFVCNDILGSSNSVPARNAALVRGFASAAIFPMTIESHSIGALFLYTGDPGSFDNEEADALRQLAADLAFGLQRIQEGAFRKQAEIMLRESEEKFRRVVQASPLGTHLYRLEQDGRLILVGANPAADSLLRIDHSQLVGMRIEEAFPGLESSGVAQQFRRACLDVTPLHIEHFEYNDPRIPGLFELHAFQTTPGLLTAQFFDISERERAEQELRRRAETEAIWNSVGRTVVSTTDLDEILKTVIETITQKMPVETGSIWLRNPNSEVLVLAKTLRGDQDRVVQSSLELGQGIAGWMAATAQPALITEMPRTPKLIPAEAELMGTVPHSILGVPLVMESETVGVIELMNKQGGAFSDDDLRLLESIAAPVAIAIQNARLHEQINKQIQQLTKLFQTVQHAKEEWELTIDSIEEGIMLIDSNCRILRANKTLAKWRKTTPANLVNKHCYLVIHGTDAPPSGCPHARLPAWHEGAIETEIEEPSLGGTLRFGSFPIYDAAGKRIGAVNVLKDITAEKRLQAQVIQSEKLAVMGRLTASLAHEINNPLQAIQGCLDLAQASAGNLEKQQRYINMAQEEFKRLTNIVQHMLDFFRPSKGTRAPVNIPGVLEDAISLSSKRLQHAKVSVTVESDPFLPQVIGFANQLQQVMLNLILNAAEAMPQGGEIRIRCSSQQDGAWLTVAVQDCGLGIAEENLHKVFEPFFTTKPNGTGLGLAVCQNIISNHKGRITAESVVKQGSTFTVWLPVKDQEEKLPAELNE